MRTVRLAFTPRFVVYTLSILITAALLLTILAYPSAFSLAVAPLAVVAALTILGTHDLIQTRHAVLRNYPISAHLRFLLEEIRPEMRVFLRRREGRNALQPRQACGGLSARQDGPRQAPVRDPVRRLCGRIRMAPPFDGAAAARNRAVPRQGRRAGLPEAL